LSRSCQPREISESKNQKKKKKAKTANAQRQKQLRLRKACDETIENLKPSQGHVYTMEENKQALLSYYIKKRENKFGGGTGEDTKTEVIENVAASLGRGSRILHDIITYYEAAETKGQVLVHSSSNRGRGSTLYVSIYISHCQYLYIHYRDL